MLRIRNRILVACVAAVLTICSAASADPPSRVGRVNLLQGEVSFRPGSMDEWAAATLNYPLTAGDGLWTDEASRAEVHVASTAVRLGPGTEIALLDLDDQALQIGLPRGRLSVRLRQLDSDESFEIDTPTMSISLVRPGSYRIEVRDNGDTQATVNEGEIEIVVDGLAYPIREHQTASVAGSDSPAVEMQRAPEADEWDWWCAGRDSREDRLSSARYVPRVMIGCEDLDWYGSWSETADYGPVWTPSSLPAGWAPYRLGRWAWVEPWGWTWVDNMPWGFAPFHYGRWALVRGAWVWVPGSMSHRPVYAPALVVFVEAQTGSAALNGRIAWFPLGPREAYAPPYRASRTYVQRLNIMHVRIGDGETIDAARIRYVNREHREAFTVVSRQSFGRAQRVDASHVEIPERELARVRVSGTTAAVVPQRESVLAFPRESDRVVSGPPERARQRPVVVQRAPSTRRTPFSEQQRELAEHPGRPIEPRTQDAQRERAPAASRWVRQPSRAAEPGSRPAPRQDSVQRAPEAQRAQQDRSSQPQRAPEEQGVSQDRSPQPQRAPEAQRDPQDLRARPQR